uniref:Uncharacterized protein n=1 Tax=Amphimedon queenslandica TaxID=400682 RepID=A0A1X7VLZ5_AMPQE
MRSSLEKVWDQTIGIAEKNGLSVAPPRPRRTPIMSRKLDGFIVDSASSLNFESFLLHYGIDELAMEAEASVVKGFLCDHDPNLCRSSNSLHKAYQLVSEVLEGFPATIKCYQIAVTIGVSSATAERRFRHLGG